MNDDLGDLYLDSVKRKLRAVGDFGTGLGETALTLGSGALAQVPAGIAGLGDFLVNPESVRHPQRALERATQRAGDTADYWTYEPRSDVGQRAVENVGEGFSAVTDPLKEHLVDPVGDRAPALGAAILAGANVIAPKGAKATKAVARLGEFPTTTAGRIVNETTKRGGYSVNLPSGERPTEGLMMGKYANTDERNAVVDALTRQKIIEMVKKNEAGLARDDTYLGTWKDPSEGGKTYVDVSRRFPSDELRQATKYGERSGQISGYNVGEGKTFDVGNWEQFVKGPEFAQRLTEMGAEGRDYLKQFGEKEWWDMHGGPFERVYGEKNLPQVAGFTAATAPNSEPRGNLQTMSEYLRRHIKGEPPVQPDWRVPEGQMTRQPGKQIGMENVRVGNLERASRGALDELQQDKVREEAQAMMGDPNAAVLDRHWARVAEDPSKGIYTSAAEGILDPGKQYQTLKAAIASHPEVASGRRSLRDFSADVWTGIRERIKNTSELYGQKYRGSSIIGESKSFADHFEHLIEDKAKHMGISKAEMESRLRSGDATLLSVMGATTLLAPIVAEVLQQPSSAQGGTD
jgi:hypothetical protein